jgi:hypothetical protein
MGEKYILSIKKSRLVVVNPETGEKTDLAEWVGFGENVEECFASPADIVISQFEKRYELPAEQKMHKHGKEWHFERKLDTSDFVVRVYDKLKDVDPENHHVGQVDIEVFYDRKVGFIDEGLKNNIAHQISEDNLQEILVPNYRNDWVHLEGKSDLTYDTTKIETFRNRLWHIHLTIDDYMRQEKHLR